MRIVTVNNHYQLGGAETVARQLHEGALGAGHDAKFCVAEGSRWPRARGLSPLYPRLLARLHESRLRRVIGKLAPRRKWTDRRFRALAQSDADVVHVHSFHGLYASIESLAFLAKSKPLVWTFHRFWGITGGCDHPFNCERYQSGCGHCPQVGRFAVGPVDRTADEWKSKQQLLADLPLTIVSPSEHLSRRVSASALGKNWNVEVIPNGVCPGRFKRRKPVDHELKRSLALAADKTTILFTSRDFRDPIKGFPLVEAALKSITRSDIQVVLVGGNSTWARSRLPVQLDVMDAGYLNNTDQLAEFYEAADVFLYASDGENLPCAVLEAMSAECCVVATPVDGVTELIEADLTGLLATGNNAEALGQTLEIALNLEEGTRRKLGERAREKVKREYSEEKMIDSYLRIYERVTAEWGAN